MENIYLLLSSSKGGIVLVLTMTFIFIVLFLLNRFLREYWEARKFQFQLVMLLLTLLAVAVIIMTLPISDTLRGQLLTLFSVLLSAAIAFASTTFIGNMLAGFMLRVIKNIKLGDYVTVVDVSGRATEMNLLHVEVQTEQSDLVTIPNILMVTHPVKVVRSTGTIVSIDISLGYDIPRVLISKQLSLAVSDAGLTDSFVQVRELGDFSVTYRASGQLKDISGLLSARSNLYCSVLDRLHSQKIEIVSPTFMNTRSVEGKVLVPKPHPVVDKSKGSLEKIAFKKAEAVASIAKVQLAIKQLSSVLDSAESQLSDVERNDIEAKIQKLTIELKMKEGELDDEQIDTDVLNSADTVSHMDPHVKN